MLTNENDDVEAAKATLLEEIEKIYAAIDQLKLQFPALLATEQALKKQVEALYKARYENDMLLISQAREFVDFLQIAPKEGILIREFLDAMNRVISAQDIWRRVIAIEERQRQSDIDMEGAFSPAELGQDSREKRVSLSTKSAGNDNDSTHPTDAEG